jgi:hypothetical protein
MQVDAPAAAAAAGGAAAPAAGAAAEGGAAQAAAAAGGAGGAAQPSDPYSAAASHLLSGSALQEAVNSIMEMGFPQVWRVWRVPRVWVCVSRKGGGGAQAEEGWWWLMVRSAARALSHTRCTQARALCTHSLHPCESFVTMACVCLTCV